MSELSGEWVVGLGLFGLLLALVWQSWFPGLSDSSPEAEPAVTATRAALQVDAEPARHADLPA